MTKPLHPDDPILGPARGTMREAVAAANRHTNFEFGISIDTEAYVAEVYRLAPLVGIDPAIVVAQSSLETDNWRSEAWVNRRNPAGIGITDDGDFNYAWADGTAAARGQIVHLWLYADMGALSEVDRRVAEMVASRYLRLDPRAYAVEEAGWLDSVTTIRDLTGKWATDPLYAEKICRRGNELFGWKETPVPQLIDLSTDAGVAEYNRMVGSGFALSPQEVDDLLTSRVVFATGRPEGICLHVQQGATKGSIKDHASVPRQASANAYVNLDGTIVLAVDRRYGAWTQGIKTSGPSASYPSERGKAFLDRVGTSDANKAVLSIEAEGFADGPHPEQQIAAIVWLCREWMRTHPHITVDKIFRHADFDVVNRSFCPGPYYDQVLAELAPPAYSHPYPAGYTAEMCAAIWGKAVPQYPFDPTQKGTVSRIWVAELILSPLIMHAKGESGREIFHFASGESVGRMAAGEAFRKLL